MSAQNGWKPAAFSADAIEVLKQYAWPGNIRELRNVVERLLLLAGDEVNAEDVRMALPACARSRPERTSADGGTGPLAQRVLAFEREAVIDGTRTSRPAYHSDCQGSWPGAKPSLQEMCAAGDRSAEFAGTRLISSRMRLTNSFPFNSLRSVSI